jgi:hypothetical protein
MGVLLGANKLIKFEQRRKDNKMTAQKQGDMVFFITKGIFKTGLCLPKASFRVVADVYRKGKSAKNGTQTLFSLSLKS